MSASTAVVAALTVVTVIAVLVMFAAFGVAIWQPWGHRNEWKNTAGLAMFFALSAGSTAALLKDFGRKR